MLPPKRVVRKMDCKRAGSTSFKVSKIRRKGSIGQIHRVQSKPRSIQMGSSGEVCQKSYLTILMCVDCY